jgi:phospholipid/cholesterol/gamma-HCH transport system permease protein
MSNHEPNTHKRITGRRVRRTIVHDVQALGFRVLGAMSELGRFAQFSVAVLFCVFTPPFRPRRLVQELFTQGVLSLIIICVCGMAVGMVLALQGYNTLVRFGAVNSLGAMVGLSLLRELGPVIAGLLITGRAGSATTAEIGSMSLTEQLDGLRMMAIDPVHFVVAPKALALIIAVPLLTALFTICGIYGGYLVGVGVMQTDAGAYMSSLRDAVVFRDDVVGSIVKSLVFGVLIALVSTFRGYTGARTAAGVSAATTSSVVVGSVSILLLDYIVTALWGM